MNTNLESQEKEVLNHLQNGNSITQLEALNKFQCLRLSDRIFRLRRKGYPIATEMVKDGSKTYGRYKLVKQ